MYTNTVLSLKVLLSSPLTNLKSGFDLRKFTGLWGQWRDVLQTLLVTFSWFKTSSFQLICSVFLLPNRAPALVFFVTWRALWGNPNQQMECRTPYLNESLLTQRKHLSCWRLSEYKPVYSVFDFHRQKTSERLSSRGGKFSAKNTGIMEAPPNTHGRVFQQTARCREHRLFQPCFLTIWLLCPATFPAGESLDSGFRQHTWEVSAREDLLLPFCGVVRRASYSTGAVTIFRIFVWKYKAAKRGFHAHRFFYRPSSLAGRRADGRCFVFLLPTYSCFRSHPSIHLFSLHCAYFWPLRARLTHTAPLFFARTFYTIRHRSHW